MKKIEKSIKLTEVRKERIQLVENKRGMSKDFDFTDTFNPLDELFDNGSFELPLIIANKNSNVISKSDFLPIVQEAFTAQRTQSFGYTADTARQKFTSYGRDNESSLDFAQARMYCYNHGRFTSPDPYNIILESQAETDKKKAQGKLIAYISKPQQWDRYTYVINNPLVYIDPSGEILMLTGSKEDNEKIYNELKKMLGEKAGKNLTYTVKSDGNWEIGYKGSGGIGVGENNEFGAALGRVIDSEKTVGMKISHSDTTDDGVGGTVNLKDTFFSGGATVVSGDGKSIGIRIHSNVVAIANNAFQRGRVIGSDGNILTTTLSTAIAHEIGHAYSAIVHKTSERYNKSWYGSDIINENNQTAVMVENLERRRLGMGLRKEH